MPPHTVQVGDKHLAGRVELAKLGRGAAHFVDGVNIQLNTHLIGDSRQMQDGIGGTSKAISERKAFWKAFSVIISLGRRLFFKSSIT